MVHTSGRCLTILQNISVEPAMLFAFLSIHIMQVVQQDGVYKVVCQQTYSNHPRIDCSHLGNSTLHGVLVETVVQKKVTMWNMALGMSYLAPALLADLVLGACGDRYGRKVNMLLGMTGTMISLYPLVVMFTYPLLVPLYILVIAHLISGFTGFISITMISSMAYIADTVLDASSLTVRMSIVSVVMNAASIMGPLIVGASARSISQAQTILLCQLLLCVAFFYCMIRLRQIPSAQMRKLVKEKTEEKGRKSKMELKTMAIQPSRPPTRTMNRPLSAESTEDKNHKSVCATPFILIKDTWRTYTKPRPGHVRAYLLCASFVFFLNIVSEMGLRANIFALYVQKAPLSWDEDMVGYFKAAQATVHMIGTTTGVVVFKKCLHFADTVILLIASLSHIVETSVMVFASTTWLVFLSAAGGFFSGLSGPCMQSFVAKQVGPDEVGKAYTAFGISANIGFLVSSAIYSPIYYATLSTFPGFVFLFASFVLSCSFLVIAWLHFDVQIKARSKETSIGKRLIRSLFDDQRAPAASPGQHGATVIVDVW